MYLSGESDEPSDLVWMVWIVIAANAAVFYGTEFREQLHAAYSMALPSSESLIESYGFNPARCSLLSAVTSLFLHGSEEHLVGNMFFLWDVIFGTGIITRRYPASFGIRHYMQEEWYAQFLWPIFKSRKAGSELARGGPMVGDAVVSVGAATIAAQTEVAAPCGMVL